MPVPERDHDLEIRRKIMADLSTVYATYTNTGGNGVLVRANYTTGNNTQGIAGRTLIVNVAKTDITSAELNTIITYIKAGKRTSGDDTTSDAFTVVGITTPTGVAFESGVTDNVVLALQGTGTFTTDNSNAYGVTGAVTTVLADFKGLQS
jgi:hypothetical protein